ncbi:nucleotidyltransferase family protein [Microbacterium esteraromaticum]|uniref:nucleotidyltransferase family protein n=1 Tax=Microbacterium esteraromaticum TaxID=57043 RepID=UPI001CD5AC2A|nr:nucleotidyltransferase family protein [Microbacterium esteraromaticum]MCA1305480.1 nucleotidyltransferase family protein [Microbacterium esteraromaticum]
MIEPAPEAAAERRASAVPASIRLRLARAAVQALAEEAGARMLHIKGDATDPSLRAVPRYGTDVDALVDPRRIRAMHDALLAHGWRVYSTFRFGSSFEHAQTYLHDTWGYFDLHRRFPGIGLADQHAFDLLWAQRSPRASAGRTYWAPGVDAQAMILVLNAARGKGGMPPVWHELDDDARARVRGLVEELHADVAFAAASGDLDDYRDHREYLLWKVTSQGGPRVVEWWARVRAQPTIGGRLRVAVQAPLVNTDRLSRRLGHAPTRRQVIVEFFHRAARGFGETASMIGRRLRGRR